MGQRSGTNQAASAATQTAPASNASAQDIQQNVANNSIGPESRRRLSVVSYPSSGNGGQSSLDIPRDTSIKAMNLELVAAFTVAFTGSPILSPLGVLSRLTAQCIINADGSRNVKILDLYMQRMMNSIQNGTPRRAYNTGAGIAATTTEPNTEWLAGTVAYPVTTQDVIVNESVDIYFENPMAYNQGKRFTNLFTKNLSTCTLQFIFNNIGTIQQDATSPVVVTYTNISIQIIPTIYENREADISSNTFDFVETNIQKQFSSQTSQFSIDLNTGNRMLGLGLLARNGDANRTLSDTCVTDLNLLLNGSTSIHTSRFRELQNSAKSRYNVRDDQFASGSHLLQGFAFVPLMKNGSIFSGIDTRLQAGTAQLQLQISTAPSSGIDAATYTNPIQVTVLQQQLIPVPQKT